MAKGSEKVATEKQPESQRGKSRFGMQPRSHRVVLPNRPPREVDHEIVSILLGGDPTSLAASLPEAGVSPVGARSTPSQEAEFPPSSPDRQVDRQHDLSDASTPLRIKSASASSETRRVPVKASRTRVSRVPESLSDRSTSIAESDPSISKRGISGQDAPLPRTDAGINSGATAEIVRDLSISSFGEFSGRWKHGMHKGQLKVCEVLYQKTYALGQTECVTSFSELARLSGLKMRQCFNIIAQLEALKFVERAKPESTSNKKDQGSLIRFYPFPKG